MEHGLTDLFAQLALLAVAASDTGDVAQQDHRAEVVDSGISVRDRAPADAEDLYYHGGVPAQETWRRQIAPTPETAVLLYLRTTACVGLGGQAV